jgi:peroxiredoxin
MRTIIFAALCLGALLSITVLAQNASAAAATVGQPAPNFTLTGSDGKSHSLADYQGKFVVLEWTNPNCPFVHKFYDSGTMQKLQTTETAKGVAWLRINSSAEDKTDYQTVSDLASYEKNNHVASTMSLVDPDGKVGHTYGARTTPHMFVIDPKGVLIYAGGIDDTPSADPATIATAKNYVTAALDEAMAGKPVTTPTARPYGCSVKYASN